MDYLSNLRDVKSVIATVFREHLCIPSPNMKYTRFGDEIDSQENLNSDLIVDMLEGENLNCDFDAFQAWSLANSDSLIGSEFSVSDKGNNSGLSTDESSEDIYTIDSAESDHSLEDELPTKLVITYHFSFETEECDQNLNDNMCDNEQDGFNDCSFCSDEEIGLLEYSSEKNGSKNNLLEECIGSNNCHGVVNVCSESDESDIVTSEATDDAEMESETQAISDENLDIDDIEISDEKEDYVSKYCGNPSTPTMRKGYIYYSSEIRLYQGELRYDDSCPEKKQNFAKKLFKKVFPSQKYVVNM